MQALRTVVKGALFLWIVCALVSVHSARAEDFSSTNFRTRDPVSNSLGASATSTSFSLTGSGGQTATGEATSTNFVVRAGFLYFDSFTPESQNWRWFDDEENETPITALGDRERGASERVGSKYRKAAVDSRESALVGKEGVKLRLQYATSSQFETPHDLVEQGACLGNSTWCYANGAGVDNAVITTSVLSDADSCALSVGVGCGTHNEFGTSTSVFTHNPGAAVEYEFTIKQAGAAASTVFFFRAIDVSSGDVVPLKAGASYPSLSTGGGILSFEIEGLPSATSTAGVTTDIDTTSTSIPFGALPFEDSAIAAQRLTVTTDAGSGYRIFAYQRQGLLAETSDEIPGITSTNDAPASWSSSCEATLSGCWGYHTDANVLAGGSTRFAPDDTYASFTSTPSEVAYGAGPSSDVSTDIVYRIEVTHEQEAGAYSSNLVYIVTPVF